MEIFPGQDESLIYNYILVMEIFLGQDGLSDKQLE